MSLVLHRLNQKLKLTDPAGILWDIEEAERKAKETRNRSVFRVGGDSLKEINQTLSECSIDIETAEID